MFLYHFDISSILTLEMCKKRKIKYLVSQMLANYTKYHKSAWGKTKAKQAKRFNM